MDNILSGVEFTNFFENRSTEYSRASTQGSWEDVFVKKIDDYSKLDFKKED